MAFSVLGSSEDQCERSHSVGYPIRLWLFQYWEAVKISVRDLTLGYPILLWLFQYWEAVKICMDQHVEITEELAEKLTPSKEDGEAGDSMERIKLLEALGEVCMLQGQYHLATKKFTQAGNKVKVMHAARTACAWAACCFILSQ